MLPQAQANGVEASAPPLTGLPAVFGRYLLLKRLSRGGMGEIFLAKIGEIEGFEKLVIIKKILPNLVENQDFIARFIDEAQVAIKLQHANIAPVYEVGRVDGEYFLALEYIEGRDLRRLMQRCRELGQRVPPDLCLYLARELANGLAYAHRRTDSKGNPLSVVHCDISPPNVMISFEGEVKIIDFGIARSALRTAGSNPNMGFGKFGYMAPEQLLRGGVIDRRTDIYAAGVVLYELLTGERLYQFPEGTDYRQIARTVCQGKFQPPSQRDGSLDSRLDPIVCRALATQKEDRYQNAEEFRDALQQKLYQMNPTISADTLSHFVDGLFSSEREREREELAEMRAVDVGAYQQEILGSATHTVTFARASLGQRVSDLLAQRHEGAGPEDRGARALIQDTDAARLRGGAGRLRGALIGAALALAVLALGAALLGRREPEVRNLAGSASSVRSPSPVPVAVPLLVEPRPAPPHRERAAPPPTQRPQRQRPASKARPAQAPAEPAGAAASTQGVEGKFKQVGQEYAEFKKRFGPRLEDRWRQILEEAALGRRDQRLEEMLNQLRREMARIRSDG